MKSTRKNLTFGLLALVAIAALFAVAGHPLVDPAVLAGIGIMPLAIGETAFDDVKNILESQGRDFQSWKAKQDSQFTELKAHTEELELKFNRQGLGNMGTGAKQSGAVQWKTANGVIVPSLTREEKAADLYSTDNSEGFILAEFAKNAIVGSRKAASGPALVPTFLVGRLIDMVRARTVVVASGSQTIVIDGPTVLAKLTSGPTVHQHTEGAEDITESDIAALPVTLNPKLLACTIPLTVELVQDSPNLNQVLNLAIASAFAAKLDALCLATLLADTNIPKSAAGQDPALWAKLLEAVGSALALNQQLPTAHIGSSADFIARAGQLASTAGTWLGKPPALNGMAEHHTTGLTAGTAFMGNFAEAFAIALRSDLRIEIVRHAKPTSASHLLIAHMRADGVVLQPAKLFKQLKTVV